MNTDLGLCSIDRKEKTGSL